MTLPRRIQLSRAPGWKLPEGAVSVARPHRWGNPFSIGDPGVPTRQEAVRRFRQWIVAAMADPEVARDLEALRGRRLACWCRLAEACHADVLIELANASHEESNEC